MFKKIINSILFCLCCLAAEISDANKELLFERAACNNDKYTVALLLKAGLNPEGITRVLAEQVLRGSVDMAKFILESGAKIDLTMYLFQKRPEGSRKRALTYAIDSGMDIEFIQLLIKSGSEHWNWPRYKNECLHEAMRASVDSNRIDVVILLINNGYNNERGLFIPTEDGFGNIEILKLLIPFLSQENKDQVFVYAVSNDGIDKVELLLNSGADVNKGLISLVNSCGRRRPEDLEAAKLLINAGADINSMHASQSVLFQACKDPALLKLLLSQPNIETEHKNKTWDDQELTAYQYAVYNNYAEAIRIFDEYYLNKLKQ